MYTQCIKCETVFRLSAEVLRAAGGQVRCGRCGEVFNALARLAEDPNAFPAGESPLDMETRADEILETAAVEPFKEPGPSPESDGEEIEIEDVDSSGIDFARLQLVDTFVDNPPAAPAATPSAEARVPPSSASPAAPSGSRLARPRAPPPAPPPPSRPAPPAVSRGATPPPAAAPPISPPAAPRRRAPATAAPAAAAGAVPDDGSMEFTLPPGELDRVFVERSVRSAASAAAITSEASEPTAAAEPTAQADVSHPLLNPGAGLEVSEEVRREMLAGISAVAPRPLAEILPPSRRSLPFGFWLGSAVVLGLLLCAQMLHGNREWLATHAPLRAPLHGLYAAFGLGADAPANLSAYQLRQWGVTGDPGASGTLRVRASILNTAAQLQPYPLLRVTLANRFGAKLGARDFAPAEYMGKPIARMLAPGERADATLDIVDPGKDAEGFEIDVCLRGLDQKISCAGDVATQAKQAPEGN